MSQYRIEIDRSLCSGFGSCADTAPGTFALGDDGIAFVREGGSDDGVIEAAGGCPMGSIAVFSKETGEQLA